MIRLVSPPPAPSLADQRRAVRAALAAILRSPASWAFAAVYLAATLTLLGTGYHEILAFQLGIGVIIGLLIVATLALTARVAGTEHAATHDPPSPASKRRTRLQLGVVALYTLYVAIFINGGAPAPAPLAHLNAGARHLPLYVRNPLLYFIVPALVLIAFRAHWRDLGIAPGWRAWRVATLWSVVPLYVIALVLLSGASPLVLLGSFTVNVLQNGFFEEFLWRGAIQTRLAALTGAHWGIVLSSLGFGLWHLVPNTVHLGGNPAAGLAYSIIFQATVGIGFACAFVRTGNLLAPSVAHVLFNVA